MDFAYAGSQGKRLAQMVQDGSIELGAIHTYLEMYSRYFIDLIPRVSLLVADEADREGNIYSGFSTEDTPAIAEATKFNQGIVIVQVNKLVDKVSRVDIPADWVDFVIESPTPYMLNPLFTRDPAKISDERILKAMMAIKGIYGEYGVQVLNHGVGFDTSAIELILPTYGESLGLRGKICRHWVLNPHPTMIPAIETGWAENLYSFGSEVGMEEYIKARPDVLPSDRTERCVPTELSARRQATMRQICLSDPPCRLTVTAILPQQQRTMWQASAALRTWGVMPRVGAM